MYTFSRAGYLAVLLGVFILGCLKDRKLLFALAIFLLSWQTIVPTAVHQRVDMTTNERGQLDLSTQSRVDLWREAEESILKSPVLGTGFATFQYVQHVHGLRDSHNWFVKVAVETGVIGIVLTAMLLGQLFLLAWRLYRRSEDTLYKGLGLGLFISLSTCAIANCFGDRWTYVEITGPLWLLAGAAARGLQLTSVEFDSKEAAPHAYPIVGTSPSLSSSVRAG
jgi:O-antigen ligase